MFLIFLLEGDFLTGYTEPLAMFATLLGNIINVILNYLLIFGLYGFPELGVEGAALGTLISRWAMVFFMAINVKKKKSFRRYNRKLFRVRLNNCLLYTSDAADE